MVAQNPAAITADECVAADASLVRAFDLLGKRWTGVLLGTLSGGPVGFRALARAVPGISDSVLAGRALLPALEQIGRWAERHLTTRDVGNSATPESALRQARRR